VQACVAFRSLLTPESLHFSYACANREFVERMASLFIVLSDGGQPLTTFHVPTPNSPNDQPMPSTSALSVATAGPVPVARPSFLLQCLAPSIARKRPNESAVVSTPTKRVAI
jgi:hypothetical protein